MAELRAPLLTFMKRRVPDTAQAEDLVQETLLRIVARWDSLQDLDRLTPWSYRIARNVLIDHYRRERSTAELPDDLVAQVADDTEATQLVGRWIAGFIQQLPEPYRTAVRLADQEGVRQVDIAKQLGLPPSTVKSRVQRGRAQVRALLTECCHIETDGQGHVIDWHPRRRCDPPCASNVVGQQPQTFTIDDAPD
ncbi:MAG: RNA polymerase sigma factor SigZ [Myxococcota bacterium]